MNMSEKLTLIAQIGVLLTFIVAVANFIFNLNNSKKTTFINSITSSRIKYIQEIRTQISDFCSIALAWKNYKENDNNDKVTELSQKANQIKFIINLYLNPEDEYWDKKIINLIDLIILNSNDWSKYYIMHKEDKESATFSKFKDYETKVNKAIQDLIIITQYLLKLEWEGVKLESRKGIISDLEKKELYNKYVGEYENYLIKTKNETPK